MERDDKIVQFPLHRRGLAGPADFPAQQTSQRLLMIANMLQSTANDTPYPIWVDGLASEIRRVVRQMRED